MIGKVIRSIFSRNKKTGYSLPDPPESLLTVLFEPRTDTIIGFIAGLFLIAILSNLFYDFLVDVGSWILWTFTCVVLLTVAFFAYQHRITAYKRLAFSVEEHTSSPNHKRGLVWMLTPSGIGHAMVAIRHHYGTGQEIYSLRHCWLIEERNNEDVRRRRHELEAQLQAEDIRISLHQVSIENLTTQATYQALLHIVDNLLSPCDLSRSQLVVDITGGTKPMTAGVVLGALSTDCLLQYVETDRDETGRPIPDSARVVYASRQPYLQDR